MDFLTKAVVEAILALHRLLGQTAPLTLIAVAVITYLLVLPAYVQIRQVMHRISAAQPQLQRLRSKYAKEPQKLSRQQAELYQQAGLGLGTGCLIPMFLIGVLLTVFGAVRALSAIVPLQTLAAQLLTQTITPAGLASLTDRMAWFALPAIEPQFVMPALMAGLTWLMMRLSFKQDGWSWVIGFAFLGFVSPSGSALILSIWLGLEALRGALFGGNLAALLPGRLIERWLKASTITPNTPRSAVTAQIGRKKLAAQIRPKAAWAHTQLGLSHLILGDPKAAALSFEKALNCDAADPMALAGLAFLHLRTENWPALDRTIARNRRPNPNLAALDALGKATRWLAGQIPTPTTPPDLKTWAKLIDAKYDFANLLKAERAYALGRLHAIGGPWTDAESHLKTAANADLTRPANAYHDAEYLLIAGKWGQADAALNAAINRLPDAISLLCLRLQQQMRQSGPQKVDPALLRRTSNLKATDWADRLLAAQYALLIGHAAQIPPPSAEMLAADPLTAYHAKRLWIAALIGRGDGAGAEQALRALDPQRLTAPERGFFQAAIKWLGGDSVGAEKEIDAALALAPAYDQALRLKIALAEARHDSKAVIAAGDKLIAALPGEARIALRLALAYRDSGQPAKAMPILEKLVTGDQGAAANLHLGRILLGMGKYAEARKCLEEAARLNAPDAAYYAWQAEARLALPRQGVTLAPSAAHKLLQGQAVKAGKLHTIPDPDIAALAALIAVQTGDQALALEGCRVLLGQVKAQLAVSKPPHADTQHNLSQTLIRCASQLSGAAKSVSPGGTHPAAELLKLLDETARSVPTLALAMQQIAGSVIATLIPQSGKGANETELKAALALLDSAAGGDRIIPALVRMNALIGLKKLDKAAARAQIRNQQQEVARALEQRLEISPVALPGLAAFLTTRKNDLRTPRDTLKRIAGALNGGGNADIRWELARCFALIRCPDEAAAHYKAACAGAKPSQALQEEYVRALCAFAAEKKSPENNFENGALAQVSEWLAEVARQIGIAGEKA